MENSVNILGCCMSHALTHNEAVHLFLFPQQEEDTACHCYPMISLHILKELRKSHVSLTAGLCKTSWFSYEQWLGKNFTGMIAWQKAMHRFRHPRPADPSAFNDYQNLLLTEGLHLENIWTKTGKLYFTAPLNPLKKLERFWLTPYHFVNASKHPCALLKTLPILFDGQAEYLFNPKTGHYDKLLPTTNYTLPNLVYLSGSKAYYAFTVEQMEYLQIPENAQLREIKLKIRERNNAPFTMGYGYRFLPKEAEQHIYFHIGLYQLMMFALGVDQGNNIIDENHTLYPALVHFTQIMREDPNNPWALPTFTRDNFFEYHLSKVFIENPELMDEAKITTKSFFNTWEHFESFQNLFDCQNPLTRKPLDKRNNHLPNEAQILAYSFSQGLRIAWAATHGKETLMTVLELPESIKKLIRFFGLLNPKTIIKRIYRPVKKSKTNATFMKTWKQIRHKLLLNLGPNMEFFSFNGHATCISFANDVLSLQSPQKLPFGKVTQELGFTIMDSLYAEVMEPFYRKTVKA